MVSSRKLTRALCYAGTLLFLQSEGAQALSIRMQPRANVGFADYSLNYDPVLTLDVQDGARVDRFSVNTTMPTVSGGLTVFMDRFFADFSAMHAFSGSASSNLNAVVPLRQSASTPAFGRSETNLRFDSDIERIEYAFTVGFQATEHFVVYAGYRDTNTNFAQATAGNIRSSLLATGGLLSGASGQLRADGDFTFDYDGPFVGASYSWDLANFVVPGALTGNVALAFMDGASRTVLQNATLDGRAVDVRGLQLNQIRPDTNGDTVGLSLGLNWRGMTPIQGLTYTLGASGYRYEFENSNAGGANFDETVIRFDAGVGYAFQL